MITTAEALRIMAQNLFTMPNLRLPITDVGGYILQEEVKADRDFPPYNRVMMDGIAIRHEQFDEGQRIFFIEHVQAAGDEENELYHEEHAIEIMTGAKLPGGTDTVIRVEDLNFFERGEKRFAEVRHDDQKQWQNIHFQGSDKEQGQTLLRPGTLISPAEIAVLASVGIDEVLVSKPPSVAVVSTGDELVEVDKKPTDFQVRRSNGYMLNTLFSQSGLSCEIYHFEDQYDILLSGIRSILNNFDMIVLSGGVSMGQRDFVPRALKELGIREHFHRVRQGPGKPLWFGSGASVSVFGLPGNPISGMVCAVRYVLPYIRESLGMKTDAPRMKIAEDFNFRPSKTYFLSVKIENSEGGGPALAYPVKANNSGDLTSLTEADGFIELPAKRVKFKAGESFPFYSFRK